MSNFLACSYSHRCSGCELIYEHSARQASQKKHHLQNLWQVAVGVETPEPQFHSIDSGGLRDVIEFQGRSGRFGLFDIDRAALVDLPGCPQMSPRLEKWYQEFRPLLPKGEKISARLRVAPNGQRGVWLDLANVDIKRLMDDRLELLALLDVAIVEIGQKRKRLIDTDRLRLADPILEPWFETYRGEEMQPTPVFGTIASFTQPGFRSNHKLIEVLNGILAKVNPRNVLEFGSGTGNLTFALAHFAEKVMALEMDELALESLRKGAAHAGFKNIETKVFDFQSTKHTLPATEIDTILADPARPGLMHVMDKMESALSRNFIYISCFAESFCTDSAKLIAHGYQLREWHIVDQFPQTRHYEIIAHFSQN